MVSLFSSTADQSPAMPETVTATTWQLAKRPEGLVNMEDFVMKTEVISTRLEDDEVLIEPEMLSVDAFLRTMLDAEAYHGAIKLGDTIPALGYGRVVASANKKHKVGSRVMGMLGAANFVKLPAQQAAMAMPMLSLPCVNPRTFLGLLGLTSGLTAHVGIYSVTTPPRRGQVAVVSGAAGATGSVAAQLAKLTGAKTIGIAGGAKKSAYLTDALKLDGAVDYRCTSKTVGEQLDALCPDGIDFYFDTVGGELLDAVLSRIRRNGRVVVCGASSQYNGNLNVGTVRGPTEYLKLAERGATMVGYNVMFYFARVPFAIAHILWLMLRKKLFMTEQVEVGIDAFAPAMVKMFTGGHIGKLLVDVKAKAKPAAA
jgi:NADPH-dependent curcumin reductase CurA